MLSPLALPFLRVSLLYFSGGGGAEKKRAEKYRMEMSSWDYSTFRARYGLPLGG